MIAEGSTTAQIIVSAVSLIVLLSCKTDPVLPSPIASLPPPAWIDHPQISSEEICAIGVSGPTYFMEDALAASKAQAYTELSRSVQVIVTSQMQTQLSGNGETSSFQLHEQAVLNAQTKLDKAQVRGQWVNPGGYTNLGQKGTVYTHVCVANVR